MTAPTITSITFDKPFYVPGETITCTVSYTSTNASDSFALNAAVTDAYTGETSTATQNFRVQAVSSSYTTPLATANPVNVTAADANPYLPSHVWTQVSNSFTNVTGVPPYNGTAVFTATAL